MPAPFNTLTSKSSYKHKHPALLALYPFTVRLLLLPNSSISGSDQPSNIASWFTGRSTRKKLGGLGRAIQRKRKGSSDLPGRYRSFVASQSRVAKPPCWRAKAALGQEKQRELSFNLCKLCFFCPSASICDLLALGKPYLRKCFVTRNRRKAKQQKRRWEIRRHQWGGSFDGWRLFFSQFWRLTAKV